MQLVVEGRPAEEFEQVRAFCRAVGLPTRLVDLGLVTSMKKRSFALPNSPSRQAKLRTTNPSGDCRPDCRWDQGGRRSASPALSSRPLSVGVAGGARFYLDTCRNTC